MFSKRKITFCVILLLMLSVAVHVFAGTINESVYEGRYAELLDGSQDSGKLTARFLQTDTMDDEKSGDCTILISPDGKVMLVDAGHAESADQVLKALDTLGITRIDYLVASHPHEDHIGGFAAVINAYEIGAVYTSRLVYETSYYLSYMNLIEKMNIPHIYLQEGDSFDFGEQVHVEVFNPQEDIVYYEGYPENSTRFVNDHSLLMKFTFVDSSMLFGGDIYAVHERELVEKYGDKLQADVLKIPHHGATTSSSKSYRNAIDPQIAVAMHSAIASMDVLEKYKREGAQAFITVIDGGVKVSTTGDGTYEIMTQLDRPADFLASK